MEIVSLDVPSSDGVHLLRGLAYVPEKYRGFVQVVHGMSEHIERYSSFMRTLADAGYLCFGYDQLGHGRTARNERELGYFAHRDGWLYLIRDVGLFHSEVERRYGGLPHILLGHSMGSFIVRCAVERGLKPERLIILGTGGPNPASGLGFAMLEAGMLHFGERSASERLESLIFDTCNRRFADEHDSYSWMTSDRAVRDAYRADPLSSFHFTLSALHDLVRLNNEANRREWFDNIDRLLPIFIASGRDDPIGDNGKGVSAVYERLREVGADVRMRLYDGRHEILNDACREQAIGDILKFCENKLF